MEQCPICHSPINVTDTQKEELRQRGVYVWIDDPLLTEQGLSGDQFKGLVFFNWRHIKEIQDARTAQEISANVSDRTIFSEINAITELKKDHINELRESTEKILNALNAQSEETIDLHRYFNYARDGVYQGTWEYGIKIDDKTEWTDVDRTTGLPSLPSEISDIRAIHIEELRYQIPVVDVEEEPQWHEFVIEPSSLILNARCPTIPYSDLTPYLEGLPIDVPIYIEDDSVAEIVEYYPGRYYVIPLSIGITFAHACYTDPITWEQTCAISNISVNERVDFEGTVTGNRTQEGKNILWYRWVGTEFNLSGASATGCDTTSLNWDLEIGGNLFTGNWESSFNIEHPNWGQSGGIYIYPEGGIQPPPYGATSGNYELHFSFNINLGDIGDGYGLSIIGQCVEIGTYNWYFEDTTGNGIADSWVCYTNGAITGTYNAIVSKYP